MTTTPDEIPREHPQRWGMFAVCEWLRWHTHVEGLEIDPANWDDVSRAAARHVLTASEVATLGDPDGIGVMVSVSPVPDILVSCAAVYLLTIELGRMGDNGAEVVAVLLAGTAGATSVGDLEHAQARAEVLELAIGLARLLTTPVDDLDTRVQQRVTTLTTPCTAHTLAAVYCLAQLNQDRPARLAELRDRFEAAS